MNTCKHTILHISHPKHTTHSHIHTYTTLHTPTSTHIHPHTYTFVPIPTHAHRFKLRNSSPAVHHNGVVAGTPLHFAHLLNHISHGLQVGAAAIRVPVGDVELAHLLCLTRLQGNTGHLSVTSCISSHPLGLTLAFWTLTVRSTKPCSLSSPSSSTVNSP